MTDNAQLNAQMSSMINEFNKQREAGFICDTKCQNSQNIRDWQHKVSKRESTLDNSSKGLLNAQRNLARYDSSYRPKFDASIAEMADKQTTELQTQFDIAYNGVMQDLDFYDTQMAFQASLKDVTGYQQGKINDMSGNIASQTGEIAVNRRKASFYSKEASGLDLIISYQQIIYWTLFAIQVIAAVTMVRKEKNILTIALLAIFPLYNILYPILQNIMTAFSLFPLP